MAAGSPQEVSVTEDVLPPDAAGNTPPARYAHTLRSGRHALRGDLMPAAGGTDAGPSPKELALLSLGLCTSMTVRMLADASHFPLRTVTVAVRERCAPGAHLPDGVELTLTLYGAALTDAQRARLLRAAENCPVKRMMSGGMRDGIKSALADAAP